jgi:MarR family transcriptional regulator, organic hydroperoxide resistance regulator
VVAVNGAPPLLLMELEGVDPLSSRAFQAFMKTLHLHRQLMLRKLVGKGRHPGQAICLGLVALHDGISQRDLADTMHLSRPRVTAILQELEREGAVVRRSDAADQRLTRVYLTDEGRRLDHEWRLLSAAYVNQTFGALSEADRGELERLLGELARHVARVLQTNDEESRS